MDPILPAETSKQDEAEPLQQAPLRDGPLAARVATRLRDAIVKGRIDPNERIKQDVVARELGVSRLPVREALRELAAEGLVLLEPDVGARVSPLDSSELIEVYLMRESLEPLVIAEATRRISEAALAEVRGVNEESEAYAERDDPLGYIRLDRQFHFGLIEASGYERIAKVIRGLWQTTERYRHVYTFLPHRLEISVVEHRLIVEAIERRSPDDAADLYRAHIRRTRLTLVQHPELMERPPNT